MKMLVVNWRCMKNPLAGGAEVYLDEVFRRLVERGHAVTQLAERFPGSAAEDSINGIRVVRIGGGNTFNFAVYRNVGRIADELDCDVVVDDLNKVPFYSPWFTKRPVLAILMHLFRGSIFKEAFAPLAAYVWLTETAIPLAYKNCRFAVLSESSKKDVVRLGIPAENITVIPPGTGFDRFRPAGQPLMNRSAAERAIGRPYTDEHRLPDESSIPNPKPKIQNPAPRPSTPRPLDPSHILLHVGRLKRYKATDHLLRAARLLTDKGIKFRVVIVGSGDDTHRLEALAAKLGLAELVTFTGFISEEEKVNWYHRAAVLVENSVKEGWGLIVMEANACGTPSVVARSPGLVDSSREGVNGLFYDYGDIAGLAEKIERLLADEPLRRRLGEQAIGWARQWTWDKAASDMESVIRRTAAERRESD